MRAHNTDKNQAHIVKLLRQAHFSVQSLHRVGEGCPDLVIAFGGRTWMVEIKQPGEELRANQVLWHQKWRGEILVLRGQEDVVRLLKDIARRPSAA